MYAEKAREFFKKLNAKSLVFTYILLMMITPIVPRLTSKFLTTYFYMVIVVVAAVFTIISCSISNVRENIVLLLPFAAFEAVVMISANSENVLLAGYQVLLFVLPVCIGYYLVTNPFFVGYHSMMIIIVVAFTCVTTIIGCMVFPNASRILATGNTSITGTSLTYDIFNIGGYGFVYSTVLMYPLVILAFKAKKLHIIPTVAITALLYYMVIQTEYTFALLLLMLSTLLFFVKRNISIKRFILLMLGFFVVVLIFRVTIAALFSYIGNLLGNQTMVDKINAAFLGTDAVDNFDDDRGALYMKSLNLFLSQPLFGSLLGGSKNVGGHSFLLDALGTYGLVGGGLLAFMYRGIYRVFYKPLEHSTGYYLVFWSFIQPIILSVINTGMWVQNLCLYAPIMFCAIYGSSVYLDKVDSPPEPLVPVRVLQRKEIQK